MCLPFSPGFWELSPTSPPADTHRSVFPISIQKLVSSTRRLCPTVRLHHRVISTTLWLHSNLEGVSWFDEWALFLCKRISRHVIPLNHTTGDLYYVHVGIVMKCTCPLAIHTPVRKWCTNNKQYGAQVMELQYGTERSVHVRTYSCKRLSTSYMYCSAAAVLYVNGTVVVRRYAR